jgi:hypothetical protein
VVSEALFFLLEQGLSPVISDVPSGPVFNKQESEMRCIIVLKPWVLQAYVGRVVEMQAGEEARVRVLLLEPIRRTKRRISGLQ